ncbi:ribosomal protein L6e-domain-containing protein [Lobosporangium transversale]|uniref:Ribosomal protein L6e-domain-containing protein n=1 Tax=Lobosporangium transversale TaxID=64571 RepID=A0A1Y2GKP0_9FUNG|nr:ribosomal protein L6e-domain-containing protein [Lobosporangium transversale]ORZ12556.1 ribosomal protein L6e-domain-containing protein [Lobosporangium transversale]|eukprot:XP_021880175.1 ribosomal protein L6e-domain-containing protein [Lobosporangium transversale]
MVHKPRNSLLTAGVSKYSRSQVIAKRALYKRKPTGTVAAAPKAANKTVEVKGGKNGGSRVIAASKAPRFYSAEDVAVPKKNRKHAGTAKLRTSIVPGTVLILLAGRYRGKRVVFLKQLESGLLLVSGPFKVNGVPLKRVNQAYVIATSTKVDIDASKVDAQLNDAYFARPKSAKKVATEEAFFEGQKKKEPLAENKVALQKSTDKLILEAVNKVEHLRQYLASKFSLSKGQAPHALKF